MEEPYPVDYFAIMRRWKKICLATTGILLALSLIFVMRWSNYRSTAVVEIEQPQISAAATTLSAEALADQQVSIIEQKTLSTSSLIDIITKFNLYPAQRHYLPATAIAAVMRKKIRLELMGGTTANPAAAAKASPQDVSAIAFKLSFDYSDPLITQQVTNELVTRFLEEDLREKHTDAQETSAFIDAQIATLENSMSQQEQKIADYEKTHGSSRPENLAFNQQSVAALTLNLQNLDSQITSNEGHIGSLRAQLAAIDPYSRVIADGQVVTAPSVQLKALQAQYASLSAQYGPDHPDVIKARHQIEALQTQIGGASPDMASLRAQIADTQTNLDVARQTYGPDHPDSVALQNQLQHLQNQLALRRVAPAATDGIIADADNPAYLQIVAELHAAEAQRKALGEQRKEMQAQQDNYLKAIIENPQTAQEIQALTRDYDNAQLRYRALKEKKMAADMALQMQQDRTGQRLTLIDPPQLPLQTQPTRLFLLMGGLLFSIIGGIGSVIVAQTLKQSIVGARHLESITGVAPLVAIPHVYTREERQRSPQNIMQQRVYALWDIISARLNPSKGSV